jgi:hypothetical protein
MKIKVIWPSIDRSDRFHPYNFIKTRKKELFDYTLVDSVKDWRTEWFYASNVEPSLAVHSDVGPVVNDLWEKAPLAAEDLKKIKSFLDRIKILKQQA